MYKWSGEYYTEKKTHRKPEGQTFFYNEQAMQYISWHLCEGKKCTATYYPLKTKSYYVQKD